MVYYHQNTIRRTLGLTKTYEHIELFTLPSFRRYSLRRLYHMHLDCFDPYKDHCSLIEYLLHGFVLFALDNLNPLSIFMYTSSSMDSYKYVITISMRHISNHLETFKLVKN